MTAIASVRIEAITPDTFPAWRALRLRALKDHPDAFGASWASSAARSLEDARDAFFSRQGPRSETWGAFTNDGTLIGTAGLFCDDGPKMGHRAHVWGMYVAPEARGMRIGERLIAEALEFARGIDGVLQVHLAVTSHNTSAKRLYERMGFVTYGVEPRVLIVDGTGYDEDLMALMLDGPDRRSGTS